MSRRKIRKYNIEKRIKEVRQLEKKLKEIRITQYKLGYVILKKPLRDGWFKTHKVSADLKESKHIKTYQEILNQIAIKTWGREKKYADRAWNEFHKNKYNNMQRTGIKYLSEQEFYKLSSAAQKHFYFYKTNAYNRFRKIYFCTLPSCFFKISYERAYITKRKIISAELEKRKQEIMGILSKPEYYRHSIYYTYNNRWYYIPYKRERRKVKMMLIPKRTELTKKGLQNCKPF